VLDLSPKVRMCGLRDVLEVLWRCPEAPKARMLSLRDVLGVFLLLGASSFKSQNVSFARRFGGVPLKVQMCLGVFSLTGVNVWFARRFGGVWRLSPTCFGAWKVPARGNMRLARRFRCVSEVQTCLDFPHN
jgi:hypothetical protein